MIYLPGRKSGWKALAKPVLILVFAGNVIGFNASAAEVPTISTVFDLACDAGYLADGIPESVWACASRTQCKQHCTDDEHVANEAQKWVLLERHCDNLEKTGVSATDHCTKFDSIATKPLVLALNHKTGEWRRRSEPDNRHVEFGVGGGVDFAAAKHESAAFVLEKTNPVLFGFEAKSISEGDIDELKQLGAIATNLGGIVVARVSQLADVPANIDAQAAVGAQTDVSAFMAAHSVDPIVSECDGQKDDARALLEKIEEKSLAAEQLKEIAEEIGEDVQLIDRRLGDAAAFVQSVENKDMAASYPFSNDSAAAGSIPLTTATTTSELGKQFADLRKKIEVFKSMPEPEDHLAEVQKLCDWYRLQLRAAIDRHSSSTERANRAEIVSGAEAILAKKSSTLTQSARLDEFEDHLLEVTLVKPGGPVSAVLIGDEVLLRKPIPHPAALKKNTATLTVTKNSVVAKNVHSRLPEELSSSVVLRPRYTDYLDIAFAITETNLGSPKFSAVNGTEEMDQKAIAQTGADSRAGNVALVADWSFAGQLCESRCKSPLYKFADRFALQFGPLLDSSNPGLVVGISVGLTDWLRLGYGRTWQQVKRLDGQSIGDSVADDDSIKTRDTFESDDYWSLSVAFKALSLFSGS